MEQVKIPENKELQHALGLLVFWGKHVPDFSIIACPLYSLTWKRAVWDWSPAHKKALKLLIFEAGTYQALDPIQPTDPLQIERGFAARGASICLWQRGLEGPTRPIDFYSQSFKDAGKQYPTQEKGLFLVSLALQEAEKILQKQSVLLRGHFEVVQPVLVGSPLALGVTQRESVRKRYAQLEHNSHICQGEEGTPKMLQIQEKT